MEFANLHVAVDNDVFAKLLRFAQLILLFDIATSAAVPAQACQRHIVNVFCDVCGKSFSNSRAYERHWTCTKLKGTSCYSQATQKVELLATRRGNMATAMLSQSLLHGHTGALCLDAKICKICTWSQKYVHASHILQILQKYEKYDEHPDGIRDPVRVFVIFYIFFYIFLKNM
jgi:hypothetical protein